MNVLMIYLSSMWGLSWIDYWLMLAIMFIGLFSLTHAKCNLEYGEFTKMLLAILPTIQKHLTFSIFMQITNIEIKSFLATHVLSLFACLVGQYLIFRNLVLNFEQNIHSCFELSIKILLFQRLKKNNNF